MHHRPQSTVPRLARSAGFSRRGDPVSKRARCGAWLLCALLAFHAPSAQAEVTVKDPGTFVVDKAGVVSADVEQRLEGWLRELEQKTTAQVKVLTVPTLDGDTGWKRQFH